MSDIDLLNRRFERERAARKAAESLLEGKSRELYFTNEKLNSLAERLHAQAEQTRAIVETAAEGIVTYDLQGEIKACNRSAEKIFQISSIAGKNIREFFEKQVAETVLFPARDTNSGSSASFEAIEVPAIRMSGKPFFADVAISRITRDNTQLFTALIRDLSKRKKLEARLGQAQKMESVGQLAAGIAHEINTPIQFVGDNINFLQGAFEDLGMMIELYEKLVESLGENKDLEPIIAEINQQRELVDLPFLKEEFPGAIRQSLEGIERVSTIVRAMKEFSQPASESKTSVDLNRSIENVLSVAVNQYRDVAKVELSLDRKVQPILCLAGQMNQTLLNLLSNSIEAISESCPSGEGLIRFSTRNEGDHVLIRIEDNGPGIPAEIRPRIFDPFFTTKEVGKGAGQGLAFVYDVIVAKHDGAIDVECPDEGGTIFEIRLSNGNPNVEKAAKNEVSFA